MFIILGAQKPSTLMAIISKPIESAVTQEIQQLPSLRKAFSLLTNSPASVLKAEASIKRNSAVEKVEAFAILGYNPNQAHHVKSTAAAAIKLPQGGKNYGVLYEGELQRPKINARWNKEQLLNQPLEVKYNGEIVYGVETEPQTQEKIVLRSVLKKSPEQIKSVRESEEFRKCAFDATAGRRLSPICIKVRHQAGSVDTAEIQLDFPQRFYKSAVLSTFEELVKANFLPYYKQQAPAQMPAGKVRLDLSFSRAGDVADVKVAHKNDAYILKTIRIPQKIQGVFMPLCVRNPPFDWIEQKATHNYAPASCRIEPEIVSTFDNKTYAYKINDCEHVLLLDGSRVLPVAVVTKKVSGEQKMVKILSGITKVELIPEAGSLKVMINGHAQTINAGETIVKKNAQTGMVIVEIKHYQDGVYHVYTPSQMLHVLTDGKSIEVVAPQLLKNRAVGLCGDLNGEEVADLPSPQKCIVKPTFAAYSYMMNKQVASAPRCAGIPPQDVAEYKREIQECVKEVIVPTAIVPLFERARTLVLPLVSAHKVEKKMNHICISKEKVKVCGGQSFASSPDMMKTKTVQYACVGAPSSKANSLEQRAKAGESLGIELGVLSTAYTKEEAEPKYCATGANGGMGMGGNNGASGMGGSGSNGFGHGGSQGGYGQGGGSGRMSGSPMGNANGGSSSGNGGSGGSSSSYGSW
jgi:hypothetical protein